MERKLDVSTSRKNRIENNRTEVLVIESNRIETHLYRFSPRKNSNCEADQRLCFRYTDSTIPPLSKSKISSLKPYLLFCVGPGWNPNCWFSHAQAHILLFLGGHKTVLYFG